MIKNYLKIAWRGLVRSKVYSTINIVGLSMSLAACMLIVLYVGHELSYDKFHDDASNIYQAETKITFGKDPIHIPYLDYSDAPEGKGSVAGIQEYLRYQKVSENVMVTNTENPSLKFSEDKILFADPNFFEFFSFNLIKGNKGEVLANPNSIVISERTATKYFADSDPIGRPLQLFGDEIFTVTGVSADPPSNSSIGFDFILPISSMLGMEKYKEDIEQGHLNFTTLFLLDESADPKMVEAGLLNSFGKNAGDDVQKKYLLRPLQSLHLGEDWAKNKYIGIFPLVALLILILALVNYASLSTARSTTRSKEVGVRKVMGAPRRAIAQQFYFESALYTVISFVLGYFLCLTLQPKFFELLGVQVDNAFIFSPEMLMSLVLLLLLTIFLAAAYPAILLSSFKPIAVLQGKLSKQQGGIALRKFFTVFQFGISVALIICAFVMDRQLDYFRHADTGVNWENIVMLPFSEKLGKHFGAFQEEVGSLPEIVETSSGILPLYKGHNMMGAQSDNSDEMIFLPTLTINKDFVSMMGLSWAIPPKDSIIKMGDRSAVIINQAAVARLNLEEDPVHQKINGQYEIKGVLKDFNYSSLHHKIGALCLFIKNDPSYKWLEKGGVLYAKVGPKTNIPTMLDGLKAKYQKYDNEQPFEYYFLDDVFDSQYKAEDRLAKIFGVFTGFAMLIAVMGLFGLATFTALQRRKEIGIRKVLGASVENVTTLLSKDFLKLVLFAICLASPFAYWFMDKWLENFAYRAPMSWWIFVLATLGTLSAAILTIGYHAIRAASANPIKSLRTE